MRRVSTNAKRRTDAYISRLPDLAPEIEINDTDRTLSKFLELGIRTRKIYFNLNLVSASFLAEVTDAEDLFFRLLMDIRQLKISLAHTNGINPATGLSPEWLLVQFLSENIPALDLFELQSLMKSSDSESYVYVEENQGRTASYAIIPTPNLLNVKSLILGTANECQLYALSLITSATKSSSQLQSIVLPYDDSVSLL